MQYMLIILLVLCITYTYAHFFNKPPHKESSWFKGFKAAEAKLKKATQENYELFCNELYLASADRTFINQHRGVMDYIQYFKQKQLYRYLPKS